VVPLRIWAPLVATFVVFLGFVLATVRRSGVARRTPPRVGTASIRRLVGTAIGGYATFLLIVLVFHRMIAGQRTVMGTAAARGALLGFAVAIPAFLLLSWLEALLRHARER
jgi:hypothetical protein